MAKEDNTAAAIEQLGSMSLGEKCAERKSEPENNEDAENNGTPTQKKLCSWCGKESDTAKKCTACKCVWYCDKECQNKHWKEHKKECKRIRRVLVKRGGKLDLGTELDVGPLGKVPPQEECPICMRVLPIHPMLTTYFNCCGKTLCRACSYQHQRKSMELAAERGQSLAPPTCAFCREPVSKSVEEALVRTRKRVELNDPVAVCNMAMKCGYGEDGLPVNRAKCIDLLRQAADHGHPDAQYQLGTFYRTGEMGLDENHEEALRYYKRAAESGHLGAHHNVGYMEESNGDIAAAMRHWRLSASGGFTDSMDSLINCFGGGVLHHDDLAETLRARYLAKDEMKSEDRDEFIKFLKSIGEYEEEYDL